MDVLLNRRSLAATAVLAATLSCRPEIVPEPYVPTDAHDGYGHALEVSGLGQTALGRAWSEAAARALRNPTTIVVPFKEALYIDPSKAFAMSYGFEVARGQRSEIQLTLHPTSDWRLYLDLFRLPTQDGEMLVHVASGGEGDLRLAFEPRRNGRYLLRVQSELLRGGNATVEIRNVASLEFPVSGRDTGAIGSGFGAPREGGRRAHHGVDIFAPRHTHVLATSRARVTRVAEWKLGGNVVWLDDRERNLRLYFAHLQTQDVREGDWVEAGDLIGTVGNSGNARTTPPHLHFGLYVRGEGAIDPGPFLEQPRRKHPNLRIDSHNLGRWMRTQRSGVKMAAAPSGDDEARMLDGNTPLFIWGGFGRSYRVALPNGDTGYVLASRTEPLDAPVDSLALARRTDVFDQPANGAAVTRRLEHGTRVDVLARFDGYYLVERLGARSDWIVVQDRVTHALTATSP